MSFARATCVLAIFLTTLLLVLPGAWTSAFAGAPLSNPARAIIGMLFVLAWICVIVKPGRRVSWAVPLTLVGLIAIKLALAASSGAPAPHGFQGVYRSDSADAPPVSFITRFRAEPFRVDRRLAFEGATFGLHFLNDVQKYGTVETLIRRDFQYPLFVTWTGYARLDETAPLDVHVAAAGRVRVEIDGQSIADRTNVSAAEVVRTPPIASGWRRIVVRYEKPGNTTPLIRARFFDSRHPERELDVLPWQPDAAALARQETYATVTSACVLIGLIVLGFGVTTALAPVRRLRRAPIGTVAVTLAIVVVMSLLAGDALLRAAPYVVLTQDLNAGDDWLAYEGHARDILHHGPLMTGGKPLGEGRAYFFYPFYPYLLAIAHAAIGEDYGAIVIVNGLAVISLIPLCWLLGWRDAHWRVGLGGVVALGAFIEFYYLARYSMAALSDSVFAPMAFIALLATRTAIERWQARWWLLCGVTMALAAATRPNFLTYVPCLALAVPLFWRKDALGSRVQRSALLVVGFLLGVMPFTVRNLIVSGKVVLLVNSWLQIPYFLITPGLPNTIRYDQNSTLGASLANAYQMVRADPLGIFWLEIRKALFTLGVTATPIGIAGTHRAHWELAALCVLFVVALARRRLPASLTFVLCVFAVSHIAAMVLAAPWTYGYKTILPLHVAFVVGAAHLLAPARGAVDGDASSTQAATGMPRPGGA